MWLCNHHHVISPAVFTPQWFTTLIFLRDGNEGLNYYYYYHNYYTTIIYLSYKRSSEVATVSTVILSNHGNSSVPLRKQAKSRSQTFQQLQRKSPLWVSTHVHPPRYSSQGPVGTFTHHNQGRLQIEWLVAESAPVHQPVFSWVFEYVILGTNRLAKSCICRWKMQTRSQFLALGSLI